MQIKSTTPIKVLKVESIKKTCKCGRNFCIETDSEEIKKTKTCTRCLELRSDT